MTPTFLVQAAGEMMMPFTEMETRARIVNRERDWEFLFCYVKFGFLVDIQVGKRIRYEWMNLPN